MPQEGALEFPLRDVFDVPDLGTTHDEIVNGESALVENYDDAIKATAGRPGYEFLTEQRAAVQRAIDEAKAQKARHAAA